MRGTMIAVMGLLVGGLAVRADDPKPASAGEADLRAARAAHDTIELGVELYNKGDRDGCFRVYQGSLVSLLPSLGHRPALAAKVKGKLDAAKGMQAAQAAFALREALDAVVNATNPAAKPLWDRLGGEKAVRAVVHDFVAAAAPDPKVNFLRNGQFKLDAKGVALLEQQLVELVSVTTGGPLKYTGRDMKTAHVGMKITDAEFDALAGHLIATLKKYSVPQA
jgi:hemoglobin